MALILQIPYNNNKSGYSHEAPQILTIVSLYIQGTKTTHHAVFAYVPFTFKFKDFSA